MSTEIEAPDIQAGAQCCALTETATINSEPDGQQAEQPTAPPVAGAAPPLAVKLPLFFDHDSQEYEANLTKRIRETAPTFIAKEKAAKLDVRIVKEMKDKLAFDLAVKKAILLGKGGRDSEWGPFVESIGLVIRTVDRWVEKKLDNDELPVWATEKLRATKHEAPEPELDNDDDDLEEDEATPIMRFTENRLECVFPFTADEKTDFVNYLCFLTAEEAKQVFIEAMRVAAEAKRGQVEPENTPPRKSHAFLDDDVETCDVGNLAAQAQSVDVALAEGELR